jgi:hypothetical protein
MLIVSTDASFPKMGISRTNFQKADFNNIYMASLKGVGYKPKTRMFWIQEKAG